MVQDTGIKQIEVPPPSSRRRTRLHQSLSLKWVRFPLLVPQEKTTLVGGFSYGAGYGNRTRDRGLGSDCFTIKLILHLQVDYSRLQWKIQPVFVEGVACTAAKIVIQ